MRPVAVLSGMGDPSFPYYFLIGTLVAGVFGVVGVVFALAAALGRRRFLRPAIALDALVFVSGLLALSWGTVHGMHGLYRTDSGTRTTELLSGLASGINVFNAALVANVVITLMITVALVRQPRENGGS